MGKSSRIGTSPRSSAYAVPGPCFVRNTTAEVAFGPVVKRTRGWVQSRLVTDTDFVAVAINLIEQLEQIEPVRAD